MGNFNTIELEYKRG